MTNETLLHSLIIVALIAALTYAARLFPYLAFGRRKRIPAAISYLGEVLPPAVMAILLVYCVRGTDFLHYPYGIPVAAATTATVLLYRLTKNNLIAMVCGTALFMVLIRIM